MTTRQTKRWHIQGMLDETDPFYAAFAEMHFTMTCATVASLSSLFHRPFPLLNNGFTRKKIVKEFL